MGWLKDSVELVLVIAKPIFEYVKRMRYPKPKSKKIGIIVAITTENDVSRIQLKNDFLATLKQQLEDGSRAKFDVIELPEHHLTRLTSRKQAETSLRRSRSTILFWGTARDRQINGIPCTVLDLQTMALHNKILLDVSSVFAQEMAELIPRRAVIPENNKLAGLELTADNIGMSARYLAAIALHFSGLSQQALGTLLDLHGLLVARSKSSVPIAVPQLHNELVKRTEMNLGAMYINLAADKEKQWRTNRHQPLLNEMNNLLDEAKKYQPDQYRLAVLRSIFYFEALDDAKRAIKELEVWKATLTDGTFACNIAFLHLYAENLPAASRFYRLGIRRGIASDTLLELLEFLEWKLGTHPEKYHLYYGLGLLEYHCREDFLSAKEYFEKFLENVPHDSYQTQVAEVIKLLQDSKSAKAKSTEIKPKIVATKKAGKSKRLSSQRKR